MNIILSILGIAAVYGGIYAMRKAYEENLKTNRIKANIKRLEAETEWYKNHTRQMIDNFCAWDITDELKQILERNDIVTSDLD